MVKIQLLAPLLSIFLAYYLPLATCFVPTVFAQSLSSLESSIATSIPESQSHSASSSPLFPCTNSDTVDDSPQAHNHQHQHCKSSIPQTMWFQYEITVTAPSRGCHLITSNVNKAVQKDISKIKIGMCNLFIQHTSASLTINENADPDVRRDMEVALNKIVPAVWVRDGTFHHTMEGEDDMPGHVKSSLMGPSLNIPIKNGRLALGTWQGIYLNEHRDMGGWGGGHSRHVVITLQGQA
eukprot:Nitzschia sp. Nitz4//scaffold94_size78252//76847//77560//NITZ4_005480-RA/size78252-processed-gene-0.17-mRNA-1//1//CDS//3329560416//6840//frame0